VSTGALRIVQAAKLIRGVLDERATKLAPANDAT
jgi:hypothetical protein